MPFRAASDIELLIQANVNQFPRRDDQLESVRILPGNLILKLNLGRGDRTNPYLLLGGGYAKVTVTPGSADPHAGAKISENDLLGSAGVGVEIGRGNAIRWFLEGRFTDISGS